MGWKNFSFSKLTAREERTMIKEVMGKILPSVSSATDLREAGKFFVEHKHSCLPVVDDGKLMGILTSVDFVQLALNLLGDN